MEKIDISLRPCFLIPIPVVQEGVTVCPNYDSTECRPVYYLFPNSPLPLRFTCVLPSCVGTLCCLRHCCARIWSLGTLPFSRPSCCLLETDGPSMVHAEQ